MSKETLSPSKPATGFTRGLAAKLFDIGEFGILKSPVFRSVPTRELDKFVKEIGPEIRNAFVEMVAERLREYKGEFDTPAAVYRLIDENRFDDTKFAAVPPELYPLIDKIDALDQVRELETPKEMGDRDLPVFLLAEGRKRGFVRGFRFAHPVTALRYSLKFPDRQLRFPLVVHFEDMGGRLCFLCLDHVTQCRTLAVQHVSEDEKTGRGTRLLVVPDEAC